VNVPERMPAGPRDDSLPRPQTPERPFVQGLFDWLEPNYEAALAAYSLGQDLRWKGTLLHRLRPQEGEQGLDLASGTGLIYRRLTRRLGPNSVVGLDINRAMLRRARRCDPGARLVQADSVRLPFRDASFDLVTAGYLFKYVPLDALAREVRRVLRPSGRFGGYDFSAPQVDRPIGRLYAHYLHRVLPALARWRADGVDRWPELFGFLSQVAAGSRWEGRVNDAFRGAGFDPVDRVASLGGAITWVWAKLPEATDRPPSPEEIR